MSGTRSRDKKDVLVLSGSMREIDISKDRKPVVYHFEFSVEADNFCKRLFEMGSVDYHYVHETAVKINSEDNQHIECAALDCGGWK